VKDIKLPLFSKHEQVSTRKMILDKTLETAVAEGLIDNQTLAYFMARTF
jgi:glycyl-tRNA synthetase